MLKKYLTLFCLLSLSPISWAQTYDINVNDDSAMFRYLLHESSGSGFGSRELDMGFYYTTTDDLFFMLGMQVVDEAGANSPGLDLGVGFKGFLASADDTDFISLSLGGQMRYIPPSYNRLDFYLEGFFSPEIVTFKDADNLLFLTARIGYEVMPQALVYIGYREIDLELDTGVDVTVEQGGHIGLEIMY